MSCCAADVVADQIAGGEPERHRDDFLQRQARPVGDHLFQSDFVVPGVHCVGCIRTIEKGLAGRKGVEDVRVNLSLKRVSIVWREGLSSGAEAMQMLADLGFDAHIFETGEEVKDQTGRQLLIALAVAGFAAMNIMLLSVSVWSGADAETTQLFHLISGLIAVPAVAFAGRPFFHSAWSALKVRRLNMDVPISLAVVLALVMSLFETMNGGEEAYFDAAVSLLFFLLIGRTLDHFMRVRARGAIDQLARLTDKDCLVVGNDNALHYMPTDDVDVGTVVRVRAGESVPLDGVIASGSADFDRALISGESEPVTLKSGDVIEAGTINLNGSVDIKVTHRVDSSFPAQILKLMQAAEGGRSRYIRVADRMAAIYAPAVHILSFATFLFWIFATGGEWQSAFHAAIAVLIITCPCALGLAVPVVHVIAATRLFNAGIMMKDGAALERLAEVDHVVFDKTGTLTQGRLEVGRVFGNKSLSGVAYALASHSSHPASQSITSYLSSVVSSRVDKQDDLVDFREVPGQGVEARIEGKLYRLGQAQFVSEINPSLPLEYRPLTSVCAGEGMAPVYFERRESLREDAVSSIKVLREQGNGFSIVSGDSMGAVHQLADQLGIEDRHGEVLPADKVAKITTLHDAGRKTLMVGDGINDAAALTAGHASMAPSQASDIGRAAADFVFTRDKLDAVPFALKIAKVSAGLVRQNFALAILYNCIAVPMAMAGLVTPLFAAIAMSASSLVVVSNSMRLHLYGRTLVDNETRPRAPQKKLENSLRQDMLSEAV